MVILGAGIGLLALCLAWAGWLVSGAVARRGASRDRERAELLQTVVKLANKDNNQAKLLVEGLKSITDAYTDSLTKMVIGYQQPTDNTKHPVLDLNSGENTFPTPLEYIPEHELMDRSMLDEEELDHLKPVPADGPGGWAE